MSKTEQRITKAILDFIQANLDKIESDGIENMIKTMEIHNKAIKQHITTDKARMLYFELLEIIVKEVRTGINPL